jgi:hypothetical protein
MTPDDDLEALVAATSFRINTSEHKRNTRGYEGIKMFRKQQPRWKNQLRAHRQHITKRKREET